MGLYGKLGIALAILEFLRRIFKFWEGSKTVAPIIYFGKQIVLQILLKILGIFDWSVRKLISGRDWENFLNSIRPIDVGVDLIRIGGGYDGSYLVPNDLESISTLISPGIGDSRAFEDEIYSRFGISSILIDPYSKPTHLNQGDLYVNKLISATSSITSITLEDIVKSYWEKHFLKRFAISKSQ